VARLKAYRALNGDLTFEQRKHLDRLLELRGESRQTWLEWLRQAIGAANPNNILSCIERLTFILQLHIPIEWARRIHQNRLVQIAREGAGTDAAHLRSLSPERRYATLVATVLDTAAILITYENQQHRASGLNLVVAAIALWNTVYLERAIRALQERSYACDQRVLAHLSPLKWEHNNLTGDYHWRRDGGLRNRKLRPLRSQPLPVKFAS